MFLVPDETIAEMQAQYAALDKLLIDPELLSACNIINSMGGVATFACCQSHLETEEFPEYGSQFYVAFRASTDDAVFWIQKTYKRFAESLELMVFNEHTGKTEWVNPRLEIDETCEVDGTDREWSLVIRVNVQSFTHADEVRLAFNNVLNTQWNYTS